MVLQAFHEDDVFLIIGALTIGYAILFQFRPQYLLDLSQVNTVIQSTAVGSSITAGFFILLWIYLEDSYLTEREKSKRWSKWNTLLPLAELALGSIWITAIIFL